MNKRIQTAINNQINAEIASAYLYLSIATYFDSISLVGFANWMKIQYQEEMFHTMKFYDYVYERGGKVELESIKLEKIKFQEPIEAFEYTLMHEQKVTKLINDLYELALNEKDYAFQSFLQWYIDEQVEEEGNVSTVIDRIKLAGKEGPGLFMLDKEMESRAFTPPAK